MGKVARISCGIYNDAMFENSSKMNNTLLYSICNAFPAIRNTKSIVPIADVHRRLHVALISVTPMPTIVVREIIGGMMKSLICHVATAGSRGVIVTL